MIRGFVRAGTDTGVGKTVHAALLHRHRGVELRSGTGNRFKPASRMTLTPRRMYGGWKPCAAGIFDPMGVRLPRPLSPHLAARCAGETIDLRALLALLPAAEATRWIVEGAGGLLVPINDSETMADWIALLGLPVLVVARTSLGTINHPCPAHARSFTHAVAQNSRRPHDRR